MEPDGFHWWNIGCHWLHICRMPASNAESDDAPSARGMLNFKDGVSSRRSSLSDKAKVDPLHQSAGKDNSV